MVTSWSIFRVGVFLLCHPMSFFGHRVRGVRFNNFLSLQNDVSGIKLVSFASWAWVLISSSIVLIKMICKRKWRLILSGSGHFFGNEFFSSTQIRKRLVGAPETSRAWSYQTWYDELLPARSSILSIQALLTLEF